MVASRQLLLPSSKTKQRTHKAKRGELNGLVVYVNVRIGLILYGSSCSTRYELNLFSGENKKMALEEKNGRKNSCFAKTAYKGVIRGN
jgi:hypothetical protein